MKNLRALPKLRDSLSFVYLEHARIDRKDGALTVHDEKGSIHVPVAALGVVLLGPGTSITHEAVKTAVENGCSILWTGEQAMRVYAQGMGETRSAVRLLRQASLHADPTLHMEVVIRMYEKRFREPIPPDLTLQQIRGREGARVRAAYVQASREYDVEWSGRIYHRANWGHGNSVNRAISTAASCLYGICHCAIVSAGYSTALGFIHTGKLLSFVYDVADLYRIDVIVPIAFQIASMEQHREIDNVERETRIMCREVFRKERLLQRVVSDIDDLMRVEGDDAQSTDVPAAGWLWQPQGVDLAAGQNYDPDPP